MNLVSQDFIQEGADHSKLHRYFVNFDLTRRQRVVENFSAIVQWDTKSLHALSELCKDACAQITPLYHDITLGVAIKSMTELPMVNDG